jgi:hypothetical protein
MQSDLVDFEPAGQGPAQQEQSCFSGHDQGKETVRAYLG